MNVLPFRVKIENSETISDWLRSFQSQQSKTRIFGHISLEEILRMNGSRAKNTLFDSLIVFENISLENICGGDVTVEAFESGLTSNYPLTCAIQPHKEIEFFLKYDASRVSESKIEWFIDNLKLIAGKLLDAEATTLDDVLDAVPQFESVRSEIEPSESLDWSSEQYAPPRNEAELELTGIWETLLDQSPISVTDDFFEIGGTSLIALSLLNEIEEQFSRKLQPATIIKNQTVEKLARLINNEVEEETFSSLVPLRASGSKPPIYCLHAGGGHVFFYRELAIHLDEDQPVYAVQRLDLDDLSQATQDIPAMARHYLADIRKIQPKGPYSLLAYCFSTSICWEMAKILVEQGEEVGIIAIVDSPPFYTDRRTSAEKIKGLANKIRKLDFSFFRTIWQGRVKYPINTNLQRLTESVDEKKHRRIKSALNSNAESYVWKPVPIKITLFRSDSTVKVPEQNKAVCEWDHLALKGVETHYFGGQHELLFELPYVKILAEQLQKSLDEASTKDEMVKTSR